MAFSPHRKAHHASSLYNNRKETYTYNRQQNINQVNLSQYSPSIRSPKLNDESQYTKLNNMSIVEELKTKLETVMRHNSHLLNENSTLTEMVNNLKVELQFHVHKRDSERAKFSAEYTTAIQELREGLRIKEGEVERLLAEVSRLHDDMYRIQVVKNNQIKSVREVHQKELAIHVRNVRKASDDNKEILELQIKKLKQFIQLRNFQFQSLKSSSKNENDKLKSEIDELNNQIKHLNQLKEIEVRQINQKYKQAINSTVKHAERETSIAVSKLQNKVRKLKQEVVNKNVEIQQVSRKNIVNTEEHQQQIININNEKQRLLQQISELQISTKENLNREKAKMRELNELELKNIENIENSHKDCLKSEVNKLMAVCFSKTEQIKKLYSNINEMKATFNLQKRQSDRLIDTLRKRINVLEQDNLQELQLLKVKMAQLHEADVKGLEQFYSNEVAVLMKQIKQLQEDRDANREKIHKGLQDNDLLRKNFEVQLTKYKAKIQDYKVKFAAANLEFREQITSLGTKMELTSQTLLRQTEQKQKGAQFFEAEKKKFHLLILGKDKQISSAYETLNRLKELHNQQVKQLRGEIASLRDSLVAKTNQMKDLRNDLQEQFEQKSLKIINQRVESPNDILINQNKQLKDRLQLLDKQLFHKAKQIDFLMKQINSLRQEVGLRAGFLQTMQLQSSAAIEDERSKLKIIMNENEVSMKDYYETKLASKNKDIGGLQAELRQKQNDIRQLIVKYNQLEKRLREMLESQQRLSEFEKKIMNLGLDQNLVKNMGQLFNKYRK